MSNIQLSTNEVTLSLNDHTFNDFDANGDIISVTYSNPETFRINATDGGVTVGKRIDAGVAVMVIRVQEFSDDDVFLNEALNGEFATLFDGSVKRPYKRDGNTVVASNTLENGTITQKPKTVHNGQDGNGLSEWTIEFRNVTRSI